PTDLSEFLEDKQIQVTAAASDLIGSVERVEFYANGVLIGSDTLAPYGVNWTPAIDNYTLTALAYDDDSSSTLSQPVRVTIVPAPSCRGSAFNGDFDYVFSDADNNPTLTFIPSALGVGSPTCILYYGTNANSLPGYPVTPNVPYPITASEGTRIYFYYTYSYPGQGEKNTSANKNSYEVGSCKATSLPDAGSGMQVTYYPNPVTHTLNMELPQGKNEVEVHSLNGALLNRITVQGETFSYDMRGLQAGIYVFKVVNEGRMQVFKVVKEN
ncbi:MAG: T9SS C-terminal target domain-containing protein, partial [Bacteroidetes bacterium]